MNKKASFEHIIKPVLVLTLIMVSFGLLIIHFGGLPNENYMYIAKQTKSIDWEPEPIDCRGTHPFNHCACGQIDVYVNDELIDTKQRCVRI